MGCTGSASRSPRGSRSTASAAPEPCPLSSSSSRARSPRVAPGPDRTLPAIVAADAVADESIATLVLTPVDGGVAARLERGAGDPLIGYRTFPATAGLAASLAVRGGLDLAALLEQEDVRFVLLAERSRTTGADVSRDPASSIAPASISAALDANVLLVAVGDTDAGRLWRVVADDEAPAAIAARPATALPILAGQLGILALTLLLAVPTGPRPRRVRAEDGTIDDPATTFDPEDDDD